MVLLLFWTPYLNDVFFKPFLIHFVAKKGKENEKIKENATLKR